MKVFLIVVVLAGLAYLGFKALVGRRPERAFAGGRVPGAVISS
jgi:hypothetical protein